MNLEEIEFQVIRAKDLEPGDIIILKCPQDILKPVLEWAQSMFKGYECRIGVMLTSMEIQIIKERPFPEAGENTSENGPSL